MFVFVGDCCVRFRVRLAGTWHWRWVPIVFWDGIVNTSSRRLREKVAVIVIILHPDEKYYANEKLIEKDVR